MNTSPVLATTYQAVLGAVISELRRKPALGVMARSSEKINQADIAANLGITVSTWSRIERGESALTVEQLVALAAFLDFPLSELFRLVETRIAELHEKGIEVAIARKDLDERSATQLSLAQLVGLTAPLALLPGGKLLAAAGYLAYRALGKSKADK